MPKSKKNIRKSGQKTLGRRLIPWVLLTLLLFIVGLIIGNLNSGVDKQSPAVDKETVPQQTRNIILYFAAQDGQSLVAESATIDDCIEDEDCLLQTVRALIAGPGEDLVAVLPDQVKVLGVSIEESLITLNLSSELIAAHPGGTQSELLTVYALANTLAANFPHLRQLQILVEGTPVDTIKGHVDLRYPVYPDFSFVEEGASPIGELITLPEESDE